MRKQKQSAQHTVGTKQMLTSFSHFAWLPGAISSLNIYIDLSFPLVRKAQGF